MATCEGPDCTREAGRAGLCRAHANQKYRGKPLTPLAAQLGGRGARGGCEVEGCDKPHRARGMCVAHHTAWLTAQRGPCEFPDCGRPQHARGWCKPHNEQRLRGEEMRPIRDREHRGLPLCEVEGCTNRQHTASIKTCRKHRDALPLPECVVPDCINPAPNRRGGPCADHKGWKKPTESRTCRGPQCKQAAKRAGYLCRRHYEQAQAGEPLTVLGEAVPAKPKPKRAPKPAGPPAEPYVPGTLWQELSRPKLQRKGLSGAKIVFVEGNVTIADGDAAMARACLARHGALDLADMLGVAA